MTKHFKRVRSSGMVPYSQAASQHGRRHASAACTPLALPNNQVLLLAVNYTPPAPLHLVVRARTAAGCVGWSVAFEGLNVCSSPRCAWENSAGLACLCDCLWRAKRPGAVRFMFFTPPLPWRIHHRRVGVEDPPHEDRVRRRDRRRMVTTG